MKLDLREISVPGNEVVATVSLQVNFLRKSFKHVVAVDRVTFDVHQGEIFGLIGPNGAGKTTTLRMICGLLKPDEGGAFNRSAGTIGYCPQHNVIWNRLTCIEQLEFMASMYGLDHDAAHKSAKNILIELGLDEVKKRKAETLSGGMQRRLSIALSLVHDPSIIILDEPESGLDPRGRLLLRDYVKMLAQKRDKAVIYTTHNLDEVDRLVDRVAIIDRGKLLIVDSIDALKKSAGDGDVLELRIMPNDRKDIERVASELRAILPDVRIVDNIIIIRARGVTKLIAGAADVCRACGLECSEVKIRENSLEDIFISLTGRRPRD